MRRNKYGIRPFPVVSWIVGLCEKKLINEWKKQQQKQDANKKTEKKKKEKGPKNQMNINKRETMQRLGQIHNIDVKILYEDCSYLTVRNEKNLASRFLPKNMSLFARIRWALIIMCNGIKAISKTPANI